MKKFKLIKEYPGSPKLGTIVEEDDGAYYIPDDSSKLSFTELDHYPYAYPEFWEEVIEKDYKILSVLLRRSDKHQIQDVSEYENTGYIEALLNCEGNSIHSVKRLSDSEIFTIEDKVNNSKFGCNGTLKGIRIIGNSNYLAFNIFADKPYVDSDDSECFLEDISKLKQPLFTTEDDVDIFEGDKVYYIETEEEPELCFKVNEYKILKHSGRFTSDSSLHPFSTKEKAEEYILMNKPCLSFQDIINTKIYAPFFMENLKKLVKQKLNQ